VRVVGLWLRCIFSLVNDGGGKGADEDWEILVALDPAEALLRVKHAERGPAKGPCRRRSSASRCA
jgi:hypothetical protein